VGKAAALYQQMDAASQRYREAQVRLQNDDETALAAMNKALADLEDIATHLGLRAGTVRAHLFRAIHKIRSELAGWRANPRMEHEPAIQ